MARISIYKGIIVVEGREPSAKILGGVVYKSKCSLSTQFESLDCVKDQLLEQVISLGGNAIIEFNYRQETSILGKFPLDKFHQKLKWYGSGKAAILPKIRVQEILERFD